MQFKCLQGLKVDGAWNEIGKLCETKTAPISDTGLRMSDLRGDTYYRIEVSAHNAIGFSKPTSLLMRTAVGESANALGSLLYYGGSAASHTCATRVDFVLFLLFSVCVQFGLFVR